MRVVMISEVARKCAACGHFRAKLLAHLNLMQQASKAIAVHAASFSPLN
jgi:hypothetical protein